MFQNMPSDVEDNNVDGYHGFLFPPIFQSITKIQTDTEENIFELMWSWTFVILIHKVGEYMWDNIYTILSAK
jgi:hypothetical protein